ncbi:uracil-DNA glycosylase [Arthrobacter sp. B1805]|uniref:uracil-DNA glycosylase n=1 Tax=Arthrobacter sp. B1805 TaxID=2058892 RepID=UPI000CE3EBD0|nr:uracil-DNA glycosylase [Arthrobacter sp. B1805]
MTRKMKDSEFRESMKQGIHLPFITTINSLVEDLREDEPPTGRGWVPYVAPNHGGAEAPVLSVLRDPGSMTSEARGSGMLSVENDDVTAALQCELLENAGLTPKNITPWNAYPWYRHDQSSGLSSRQVTEGIDPLRRLVGLLPDLKVVLLQGREAQLLWKRFSKEHPEIAGRYVAVESYHPGRTALRHPDPAVRHARDARRREAFHEVAGVLSGEGPTRR